MRFGRRTVALLAVLAASATVVAGCTSSAKASKGAHGGATDTITLYNGQHEQTTDALVKAFTAQTGIKVKVRNDDEDVLAQQIEQEGADSPADVFYTENSPALAELSSKDLLAPVDATTLAGVPATDNSPTGDWVGVSARVSMLVYNTDSVDQGGSCRRRSWISPTRSGTASSRSRPARPTSSRSSRRSPRPRAKPPRSPGSRPSRRTGEPRLPGQRDDRRRR